MHKNATYDVCIRCAIYDEYYNTYEILGNAETVEVAIESLLKCGITPDIQPFRGGTDGYIITSKFFPNLFTTGAEDS